jgi:DNA-binding beta-propeller fold protein YncE
MVSTSRFSAAIQRGTIIVGGVPSRVECGFANILRDPTPHAVAFDGTNIWVANNGNNTVTKIPVF